MEEENKKTTATKKTTSSEVQKKKTTKKAVNKKVDINSDDLYEQIKNKSKEKKSKAKSKSNTPKNTRTTTKKVTNQKKSVTGIVDSSSDDLYEQIKKKKVEKKTSTTKKTSVKKTEPRKIEIDTSTKSFTFDTQMTLEEAEAIGALEEQEDKHEEIISFEKEDLSNTKIEQIVDTEHEKVVDNFDDKDTIITRELNFSADKFDVKNPDLLDELRKAIDDYDYLDDLEEAKNLDKENKKEYVDSFETKQLVVTRTRSDRYKDLEDETTDDFVNLISQKNLKPKKKKIKFNKKSLIKLIVFFVVLVLTIVGIVIFINGKNESGGNTIDSSSNHKEEVDLRPQQYSDCLKRPYSESDNTQALVDAQLAFSDYITKEYEASIAYEDLLTGYRVNYNTNLIYYAASTAKTVGALYLYEKASLGEINLDDTMTYTKKYKRSSSAGMKNHSYGDKVSLRELVKHSITVSDNTAHQMIVSYIGKDKLKEYGHSLGAKHTLDGKDNYGNITPYDAIIYVKKLNQFINTNTEDALQLKEYFVTASQNGLEQPELGIQAAHKYGQYAPHYHDIGIVYDTKPYVVAILTLECSGKYEEKMQDISKKVYDLHKAFHANRENICHLEVYGN